MDAHRDLVKSVPVKIPGCHTDATQPLAGAAGFFKQGQFVLRQVESGELAGSTVVIINKDYNFPAATVRVTAAGARRDELAGHQNDLIGKIPVQVTGCDVEAGGTTLHAVAVSGKKNVGDGCGLCG